MLLDILLVLVSSGIPVSSWVVPTHTIAPIPPSGRRRTFRPDVLLHSDVLDVEFERVNPENATSKGRSEENLDLLGRLKTKSLFDLSLESDPDFTESRIPFIDYSARNEGGTNYIDVRMAFMADLDGVQYGIGMPFDSVVALAFEKPDGSVQYLPPDIDENEELMQIMATQLHDNVGADLQLQRTPRVLTVAGPLDNYTKNWREKLLPDPVETKALMDTSDDDLDFFHKFMREELGDEEYEKTMNEEDDDDDDELTAELLELFEVPGLGDNKDAESMKELMGSLLTPEKDFEKAKESLGLDNLDHEGVALKLISYVFREGKSYSLVKLLRPYVIVGRFVPDESDPRFELLTPDEEKVVLPRLEEVCKADLKRVGLTSLSN